jgi:hypothetical protein
MGRSDIKDTREKLKEAEFMRGVLQDLDAIKSIIPNMAEQALIGCGDEVFKDDDETTIEGVKALLRQMGIRQIEDNFGYIHEHAESPIEIIFFGSLCMFFAMYHPLSAVFSPPINVDRYAESIRKEHELVLSWWRRYQEINGDDAYGFLELVEKAGFDENDLYRTRRHIIDYDMFDQYNSYHFTLQPEMDIQVKGKNIRPDLYIWLPSDPAFKVIVECDGFKFHGDQTSFSSDRARDRVLQRNGFQVFRYSGRGIYHNPVDMAFELFNHLQILKGEEGFDEEESE